MQINNTLDIDTFVNTNNVNATAALTLEHTNDWDAIVTQFATQHNIQHTSINDEADPVFVYMQNDTAVAWFDVENACGYVS
jgi:hypothetical protein